MFSVHLYVPNAIFYAIRLRFLSIAPFISGLSVPTVLNYQPEAAASMAQQHALCTEFMNPVGSSPYLY